MADPRLQWRQIVAPDLSGASAALARANQAFSSGIGSANDLLAKYGAGQQEKADAALLSDLAGLGDEAEFDQFVDNGGLAGRNISAAMRDHVLGARTGFVRDAGVRANTEGTIARTAIAKAAEGRNAADFEFNDGRRRELADLSGNVVGANQEGNQYGRDGGNAVQAKVYQGLLDRGLPEHVAQGFMMNFQDESGFKLDVEEGTPNVHGTRGRGLYQLTGDRRSRFEAKYGNNYSVDNQLDFMMEELGGSESAAAQAIFNSKSAGEAGAAIVSQFLRPAEEHRISRSNAYLGSNGFQVPNAKPQFNRLQQALSASQYLSPSDINGLLGGAYQAQEIGQNRLDGASAAQLQAAQDAAVLGAFNDPTVTADPNSQLAAAQDAGLPPGATLDLFGRISGAAQANQGIFNPQAPQDPLTAAAIAAEAEEQARLASNTPEQRLLREANTMDENPVKSLTDRFDMDLGTSEREELDTMIDTLADEMKISRGEAALALAETHKAPNLIRFDRVQSRFSMDDAREIASSLFSSDARRRAGDSEAIQLRNNVEKQSGIDRLQKLESDALRYSAAGREVPEALQREITKTKDIVRSGSSPEEVSQKLTTYLARTGMNSRLEGLDPESPEFFRAMADLETAIQSDSTLSAEDKRLLILAVRG